MRFTTKMHWSGRECIVTLSRGPIVLARMTLDDWLELEVNKYAIEDAARQAAHEARLQAIEPWQATDQAEMRSLAYRSSRFTALCMIEPRTNREARDQNSLSRRVR